MDFSSSDTVKLIYENPYFADGQPITTNSVWSDSAGFSVTSSSFYRPHTVAWRAFHAFNEFNHDVSGYMSGGDLQPEWIIITYPRQVYLQSYRLTASYVSNSFHLTSWKMEGSNDDGSSWNDLEDIQSSDSVWSKGQITDVSVSAIVPYSSFRLYMYKSEFTLRALYRVQMFTSDTLINFDYSTYSMSNSITIDNSLQLIVSLDSEKGIYWDYYINPTNIFNCTNNLDSNKIPTNQNYRPRLHRKGDSYQDLCLNIYFLL